MYSKVILGFLLFFGSQFSTANHAIYLSVVEISRNAISIKVFSDDLQDVIRNYSVEYLVNHQTNFFDLNKEIINSYFNDTFKIEINGKSQSFKLVSSKKENDAHFLYFSFENQLSWVKMELRGDFFTELFPDQSNIITVINDGNKYYARLTKSNPSYTLTFD